MNESPTRTMNSQKALQIASAVCLILAAFNIVEPHQVNLVPLGLALYVISRLL